MMPEIVRPTSYRLICLSNPWLSKGDHILFFLVVFLGLPSQTGDAARGYKEGLTLSQAATIRKYQE